MPGDLLHESHLSTGVRTPEWGEGLMRRDRHPASDCTEHAGGRAPPSSLGSALDGQTQGSSLCGELAVCLFPGRFVQCAERYGRRVLSGVLGALSRDPKSRLGKCLCLWSTARWWQLCWRR